MAHAKVYVVWLFNAYPEYRLQGVFSEWSEAVTVVNDLKAQGFYAYIEQHAQHNPQR